MANTFLRKISRNIGNVATAVGNYTVAGNSGAVVLGLSISNTTPNEVYANVSINNGTDNFYLVKYAPIPDGSTLIVVGGDQKLILQPGDSVKVESTAVNSLDSMMSIMETEGVGITGDPITYSITSNRSSVNEGNTVGFTVSTSSVPNSTVLYWTTVGNVSSADFTDSVTSGNVTIANSGAIITRTLTADSTTEGVEYFDLALRTDSISGNIVATSGNVIVVDTSLDPPASPITYTYEVDYSFAGLRVSSVSTGLDENNYIQISSDAPFGFSNIAAYNQMLALTSGQELSFEIGSPADTYVGTISGAWVDIYDGTNWQANINFSVSPAPTAGADVPQTVTFTPE
jgi:hypothetical protein